MGWGRGGASIRVGGFWQRIAAFTLIAIAGSALAAEASAPQILYFEPLRLRDSQSSSQQKSTAARELQFDAYGRRFVVSLQPNEKLSPLLESKSAVTSVALYKGQLDGTAHSWARIATIDGELRGMLWDGSELYIIEPVAKLRDSLPADVQASGDTTAIFRLHDVLMKADATACGTDTSVAQDSKGSDAYGSLLNELKSAPAIMQAAGASRRLDLSALGDMLFTDRYGTEARARAEILIRLNYVDGIFSHQLGVEIRVPTVDIGDSLSPATSPDSLLKELGELRKRSPNLHSRGLTHLFTGRDLDGEVVGMAFLDTLCDRQGGVGLTEARSYSAWIEALIAAHEIGHNFGASHDGDAKGSCPAAPNDRFLMAPKINGKDDFSACSLQVMQPRIASASCITALPAADIAVEADLGVFQQPVGTQFDWSLTVSNVGGLATTNSRAEIVLPPAITVEEAFVIGGWCLSGAGTISCQLGDIAGGSSTAINLTLRSDVVGANHVTVKVSASNETQGGNNSGEGTIEIDPEADLGVGLQAPAAVDGGSPFNVSLTATNLSSSAAHGVTVSVDLPDGFTASSATLDGTNCTVQSAAILCFLNSLASGATVTGTASLVASRGGSALLEARIAGDYLDPIAANDTASATISVTASASATRMSSSSGGGGGSTSWPMLWALFALVSLKNLQRRAAR